MGQLSVKKYKELAKSDSDILRIKIIENYANLFLYLKRIKKNFKISKTHKNHFRILTLVVVLPPTPSSTPQH